MLQFGFLPASCVTFEICSVVSAYVSGEKGGLILENPYHMGDTLNGSTGLDIDNEVRLVEEKLKELHAENATEAEITIAMKDFGIERFVIIGFNMTIIYIHATMKFHMWYLLLFLWDYSKLNILILIKLKDNL